MVNGLIKEYEYVDLVPGDIILNHKERSVLRCYKWTHIKAGTVHIVIGCLGVTTIIFGANGLRYVHALKKHYTKV